MTTESHEEDTHVRPAGGGPARLRLVARAAPSRRAVTPLGTSPLAGGELIGLGPVEARHHVHIPGPTGTGKSTLLLNTVIGHARSGRGVAVFDPKGDLIRDLLDRLPAAVAGRLVLIDPDETKAPAALNLFDLGGRLTAEPGRPADPEQAADLLAGVMAKVWAQYWGPRTDDLARHSVLTLAHLPGSTLADLPPLLADPGHRRRVLARVADQAGPAAYAGLGAFWAWYDSLSPAQAATQIGPLLSKLRAVLSRRFAATLFGTGESTFSLRDILDGGILLVRLPPTLGEDTVRLTGSLLLAALLRAASDRASQPETERLDAALVLDECHTFLNLPVGAEQALATARALRLSVWLAHQHLDQLSPQMAAAIDANARNKILFAVSPRDARTLAHHVAPYFTAEDLTRQDAYGIICRLLIGGRDGEPFTLTTRPAPPPWPGRANLLREAARARGLPAAQREALANARRLGPAAPTHPGGRPRPVSPTGSQATPADRASTTPPRPPRPSRPPPRGTH